MSKLRAACLLTFLIGSVLDLSTMADAAPLARGNQVVARWGKGHLSNALAYSPTGRLIAIGTNLGVRLDDPVGGAYIRTLETPSTVLSVLFSPDGKIVIAGLADYSIRIWNLSNGKLLRTLRGHSTGVIAIAISPDGRLLASVEELDRAGGPVVYPQRLMRLWRIADGTLDHRLDHAIVSHEVISVAFAPDGQTLALGRGNATVQLWSLRDGKLLRALRTADQFLAFSADSQILASTSGAMVRLWRVADGTLLHTLDEDHDFIHAIAFAPDGKTLAVAIGDISSTAIGRPSAIDVWRVRDGKLIFTVADHKAWVGALSFSPDGKILATASVDQTVRLWRSADGISLGVLAEFSGEMCCATFSPDGKTAAVGTLALGVQIRQVPYGQIVRTLGADMGNISSISFTPDGDIIAAGAGGVVRLWRATDGVPLRTLRTDLWYVESLAFSPDGHTLAVGGRPFAGQLATQVWRVSDGRKLYSLGPCCRSPSSVAFTPDGLAIVESSVSEIDSKIRLWSVSNGMLLREWQVNGGSMALAPNGQTIALTSAKHGVQLWRMQDGVLLRTVERNLDAISLSFSPDSRTLAVGSKDGRARLWRVRDGALQHELSGPVDFVTGLHFTPNGKTLAVSSLSGTVSLWTLSR